MNGFSLPWAVGAGIISSFGTSILLHALKKAWASTRKLIRFGVPTLVGVFFAVLVGLMIGNQSGQPYLFREDFDSSLEQLSHARDRGPASNQGWATSLNGGRLRLVRIDGEPAFVCARDSVAEPGTNTGLSIGIDGQALRGKTVMVRGRARWEGIQKGPGDYDFGQLHLYYAIKTSDSQKQVWEAVPNIKGTQDDWVIISATRDHTFEGNKTANPQEIYIVPEASKDMTLTVGLQNCMGTLYFDYVEIVEVPTVD